MSWCRRPSTPCCTRMSVSSMVLPDPCMWPVHGMTVSGMHSCLHTISYRGKIHIETLADRRCGDSTCGCLCETQVAGLTRKAQVLPHQGLVCLRSDAGRGNTANTGTARRTHLLTSALGRDDFDGRGEVACTNRGARTCPYTREERGRSAGLWSLCTSAERASRACRAHAVAGAGRRSCLKRARLTNCEHCGRSMRDRKPKNKRAQLIPVVLQLPEKHVQ
jgi:hypothetical protein